MEQVAGDKLMTEAAVAAVASPVGTGAGLLLPKAGPLSRAAIVRSQVRKTVEAMGGKAHLFRSCFWPVRRWRLPA